MHQFHSAPLVPGLDVRWIPSEYHCSGQLLRIEALSRAGQGVAEN